MGRLTRIEHDRVTGLRSFQGLMEEVGSEEKITAMCQVFQIEDIARATRITPSKKKKKRERAGKNTRYY